MVATRSNAGESVNRQSFTGKDLTFIEIRFKTEFTQSATNPDTILSAFHRVSQAIQGDGANVSGATILAQTYELGKKATERDREQLFTDVIAEDDLIDIFKFMVEGSIDQIAAGSTNQGLDSTAPRVALELAIESAFSADGSIYEDSSDQFLAIRMGTLPADGIKSTVTKNNTEHEVWDHRQNHPY